MFFMRWIPKYVIRLPLIVRLALVVLILLSGIITLTLLGAQATIDTIDCLRSTDYLIDTRVGHIKPRLFLPYSSITSPDERMVAQTYFNYETGDGGPAAVVDEEGRQLFALPYRTYRTQWTPDSRYLVYASWTAAENGAYGSNHQVFVLDTQSWTTHTSDLAHHALPSENGYRQYLALYFSPDMRYVAFEDYSDDYLSQSQIVIYSIPDLRLIKPFFQDEMTTWHGWSPDSQHLSYTIWKETEVTYEYSEVTVTVFSPESGVVATVSSGTTVEGTYLPSWDTSVAWTGDGQHVAVRIPAATGGLRVHILGMNGETPREFTVSNDIDAAPLLSNYLGWSLDDSSLFFWRNQSPDTNELVEYSIAEERIEMLVNDVTGIWGSGYNQQQYFLITRSVDEGVSVELMDVYGRDRRQLLEVPFITSIGSISYTYKALAIAFTWTDADDISHGLWARTDVDRQQAFSSSANEFFWQEDNVTLFFIQQQQNAMALYRLDGITGEISLVLDGMQTISRANYANNNQFYWATPDGQSGVDVYSLKGQRQHCFVLDPMLHGFAYYTLSWSSDRTPVILSAGYDSDYDGFVPQQFQYFSADGMRSHLLLESGQEASANISWSRDGRRFATSSGRSYYEQFVRVYNAAGEQVDEFGPLSDLFRSNSGRDSAYLDWMRCGE